MRVLIDADLPYSLVPLIVGYGHSAIHVRDVQLGGAADAVIAAFAAAEGFTLLTGDFDSPTSATIDPVSTTASSSWCCDPKWFPVTSTHW